jgi:hypothetical protein
MPQRTNDFQELVARVHRALAPEGAIVTESAMVETSVEGETREIDVLIETNVAPYRIRIAVEAKDEGRPMDSTKFESIIGKYLVEGGVKVNKIAVVTHHGFYEPVVRRARTLGIDLLTLTEAQQVDWSRLRPPGPRFENPCLIEDLSFGSAVQMNEGVLREGRVTCSCGRNYGTPLQFAQRLFWEVGVRRCADQLSAVDREATSNPDGKKAKLSLGQVSNAEHQRSLCIKNERYRIDEVSFQANFKKSEKKTTATPRIQFSLPPHVCRIEFTPPIPNADSKQVAENGRLVCTCCKKDHGSVGEWMKSCIAPLLEPTSEAQRLLVDGVRASPDGHAYLSVVLPVKQIHRIVFKGLEHEVNELTVQIHAVAATAELQLKQFELSSPDGPMKLVSELGATVAGKKVKIVFPDGGESKQICVQIDKADAVTEAPV